MEALTLGQVIAERRYVHLSGSGSKDEVVVRIGVPQNSPDHGVFFCPFEIVGMATPKIKYACGADAIQAMQLTLKMIGAEMHYFRQQRGNDLYLLEEGDDLGFPEEAWTEGLGWQIARAFGPIYGLKLSIARNAGSMKNFQFGTITAHSSGTGTVGQYALHIQCPWRMVEAQCAWRLPKGNLIVTGSGDWWEPAERSEDFDWFEWNDQRQTLSLQQKALAEFFTQYDEATKSWVNVSDHLIVQQVESDDYGGLDIHLSDGFRLQVFPSGKSGEQWRYFRPNTEEPHYVLEDGKLWTGKSD